MNKTFKLYQLHDEGSDCTAPYRVDVIGKPSVIEIISEIMTTSEFGSIEIYSNGRQKCVYWYEYGLERIRPWDAKPIDPTCKGYCNHIVTDGRAVGGWGRMDYTLYIN